MIRTHAPGDKPHITDVKEQRLSGFLVALMVGLSVTMAPLLRLIPMSVLFGVFLYMGIASMSGVQFFERCRLFFMPVKHHPQVPMVRRVPTWKMHLFTSLQVLSLAILWAVKSSKFSLAFPFFLLMMVPLRIKMASFFTALELRAVCNYFIIIFFPIYYFHLKISSLMAINRTLIQKMNQISMNRHQFRLK